MHASCKGVVEKERRVCHISGWFSVWLLWKKREKSVVRNVNVISMKDKIVVWLCSLHRPPP